MIEAKTLRALAKHSGYKPSSIFRMQPAEILEMLTEKYPDIKEWSDAKAQEEITSLTSSSKPETKEVVTETKPEVAPTTTSEPKKRTRRTKAQIAADKEKSEAVEEESSESSESTTTSARPSVPSRKRKKKTPVLQTNIGGVSSEEIDVLREMITTLQEDVTSLTRALDDVSMFMAWFHNVKVDPSEPIEHLASIDWAACVEEQCK